MYDSVECVSVSFGNDSVLIVAKNKDNTEEQLSSCDPWYSSCAVCYGGGTENGNLRE